MPMAHYEWRGYKFRISTNILTKKMVSWSTPIFLENRRLGKQTLPHEMWAALDVYIKHQGYGGLDPIEYLDKLFDKVG